MRNTLAKSRILSTWFIQFVLLLSPSIVTAADSNAEPQWQLIADCAAGYLGNWQNRQSDPERAPDMSTMIRELSDEYKVAAIRFYVRELHSTEAVAEQEVSKRMEDALAGFIAMDKKGELIPFLDACPQPYDEDQ